MSVSETQNSNLVYNTATINLIISNKEQKYNSKFHRIKSVPTTVSKCYTFGLLVMFYRFIYFHDK